MLIGVFEFDDVSRVVGEEDAVEVVELVLEDLRQEAACAALDTLAALATSAQCHALVPLGVPVFAANRETPLIGLLLFTRTPYDLGVDVYIYLRG